MFYPCKHLTPPMLAGAITALALLNGCVPLPLLVATGAGVTLAASSTEKGLATSFSDSAIHLKITEAYFKNDLNVFGEVEVEVNQGSVLLVGNVEEPAHAITAIQLAWKVEGVTEVIDEINVTDNSSIRDAAKDFAAEAQLRSKLIADKDIKSLNYSINIVNGVVYLSGVAGDQEEVNRVIAHAQELRHANSVVNYIRLNN